MTRPEDALELARRRAAAARARGGYAVGVGESAAPVRDVRKDLLALAAREPDFSNVRSTRALGAPVTYLKRSLLGALSEPTAELLARRRANQTGLANSIAALSERVDRLEPG